MLLPSPLQGAKAPIELRLSDVVGVEIVERHDTWCAPCHDVWKDDLPLASYTRRQVTRAEAAKDPSEAVRCVKCDAPLVCVVVGSNEKVAPGWRSTFFDPRDGDGTYYISDEGDGYTGSEIYAAVEHYYGGVDDRQALFLRARTLFFSGALDGQSPSTLIDEERRAGRLFGAFDEGLIAASGMVLLPACMEAGGRTYRSAPIIRLDTGQATAFDALCARQGRGHYFANGALPLAGNALLVDVSEFWSRAWESDPRQEELASWLLAQAAPVPGVLVTLRADEALSAEAYVTMAAAYDATARAVCAWQSWILVCTRQA